MKRGLFIGRFQPFHNGHLCVVKSICDECDELIIGVGSSQNNFERKNPFTFNERFEMIYESTKDIDTPIFILPIPDLPDNLMWVNNVLSIVPEFYNVYSGNTLVQELFMQIGIPVDILNRGSVFESGTSIRGLIVNNQSDIWKEHVPYGTSEVMNKMNLNNRLQRLK